MRVRVSDLPQRLEEDDAALVARTAGRLGLRPESLSGLVVLKRSLDARRKGHPRWLLQVEVSIEGELGALPRGVLPAPEPEPPPPRARAPARRPIVLGAGPAGLFCAHALLERGVPSVVDKSIHHLPRQNRPGKASGSCGS